MKSVLPSALTALLVLTACDGGGTTPAPDTTAPTVALSRSPVPSGDLTLTATVHDDTGVKKVEFYQGATLLATDTTSPFTYTLAVTDARTGFTARAYDAAGNVGTSPAFNVTTLYQGVWGWAIGTADGTTVLDSGSSVVSYESGPVGAGAGIVAGGVYQNAAGTISGDMLLGPISTAGAIETGFLRTVSSGGAAFVSEYFFGADSDGAMTTVQGKATFEGSGRLEKPDGTTQAITVSLVQSSAELPTGMKASPDARERARTAAISHLHGGTGATTLKALQRALRHVAER